MRAECGFANETTPKSTGGLILCGMNWGQAPGAQAPVPEGDVVPWTPYFSHSKNSYRFRNTLMGWFQCWGYPLNAETPTELDGAISQTNLFFDSSREFRQIEHTEADWIAALTRLLRGCKTLRASGLILFSTEVADKLQWFLKEGKLQDWTTYIGDPLEWSQPEFNRLKLRFASVTDPLLLANCVHPRRCPAHDDVKKANEKMGTWIGKVMKLYRQIQAEPRPEPYR